MYLFPLAACPVLLFLSVFLFYFILFFFGSTACGILVPQPGIKAMPLAVEARSPNHWTAREVPLVSFFFILDVLKFHSLCVCVCVCEMNVHACTHIILCNFCSTPCIFSPCIELLISVITFFYFQVLKLVPVTIPSLFL